ncbi:MAG: rRNA pseudouridine synthase [Henriciella sp.]|nr:rRNA pseudouridine synthase [Henriciella sp.]MBO6695102.1 rRNA pseudouridine synthase [Henriciella sp.]
MADQHLYRGNAPVRVNKWMAELGLCSRREAEALIEAGGVIIDEVVIERPGHKIEPGQTLTLTDVAERAIAEKFTAVLNKPVDYVSAQPEDGQVPAVRLLKTSNATDGSRGPGKTASLAPLGRLDQDSHGLLLLSEDGVLAKAIIGPQHSLEKEYLVTVRGEIKEGRLTLLRNGLTLDNRRLKPAKVTREEGQVLRFILKEGRKRQIRRMCDLVGLRVTDLQRIRIGPLNLGDLPIGKWRTLKAKERATLIAASLPPRPKRLTDEDGKPIRKGRSFVGRGGAKPNRDKSKEIDEYRKRKSRNNRDD